MMERGEGRDTYRWLIVLAAGTVGGLVAMIFSFVTDWNMRDLFASSSDAPSLWLVFILLVMCSLWSCVSLCYTAAARKSREINGGAAAHDGARSEDSLCVVCLDRTCTVQLRPCNHAVFCLECAARCKRVCPLCRTHFSTMVCWINADGHPDTLQYVEC